MSAAVVVVVVGSGGADLRGRLSSLVSKNSAAVEVCAAPVVAAAVEEAARVDQISAHSLTCTHLAR